VSNAGQNVRIVGGGTGAVNTDTPLNPGDPNVVGAAYSNNQPGGQNGQTTLYDIDSVLDQLFTQGSVDFPPGVSPNTGTLFSVGPLGVNTSDLVGFDISGATGVAFASLTPPTGAASSLYTINLATGAATLVGTIGGGLLLQDISVLTVASVPSPASLGLVGAGALGLGFLAARGRRRGPLLKIVSARAQGVSRRYPTRPGGSLLGHITCRDRRTCPVRERR
jgi:hypothetical protein